ncbi:hypothetical protein FN846DRAFT_931736 [Sphaerosporella brunnea]|uniref:Uncharacterized protein n=1 Tax=Sphaerosporella brunnea TaxID=1250544 RepID=A0A5J5F7Z5_9PEZI|nr:hypothetical protein FN846DRAFT_931736 [Sphaerosporella brunnea]
MALAAEILRVITAPYAVSLINLDDVLKKARQHEIQAWADSHPCQIRALSNAAIEALQYCPYGLSVIEKLGAVEQLRDEMLLQKPILLDTLMRGALQDDMNFQKFSPALVALLSTPLPPHSPPPAKLVAFFLRCLDRATKSPSISTIRPLYVLVANGYKHLTHQMSESQSHSFTKRMAGFLAEKVSADTDVNTFLTYCLATLAHMHLASRGKTAAIGEIFQGKKAPMVLTLVINIVNVLASHETGVVDWQEKVKIIKMATVIATAVSDQVKANGASSSDAASLARLLEKAKAQEDPRVVSEVVQFVSTLSLVSPPAPLKATIEVLVSRGRKEAASNMFLPLISTAFFAQAAPQRLVGDMLRSVIKRASTHNEASYSSYLLLRGRIEFIQTLSDSIPQSPHLRRHVLAALSTPEVVPLVNSFISHSIKSPAAPEACGDSGEACQWIIADLTNRLQLSLCTFILRCSLYNSRDEEAVLSPTTATAIMEKLTRISSTVKCPFENTLKAKTAHQDVLSLIEESASPEARISSRNWRQSLTQGLARQHGYIVSTLGEICRDLERRCENVEKPLRTEEENSRKLQAEVDKLNGRCKEVKEQLDRCIDNLDHTSAENEMLEKKLDCVMAKNRETMKRVKELEKEKEDAKQNIDELEKELADNQAKLERELAEAKAAHLEEVKAVRNAADQAAMDHMVVLNSRQESNEQLQVRVRELEEQVDEAEDEVSFLWEEKDRLESVLASAHEELSASNARVAALNDSNSFLSAEKSSLQEQNSALQMDIDQKLRDIDRQEQMLDELHYKMRRQNEQIILLGRTRHDLDARVQELETEVETAIRDGEEKLENVTSELEEKHEQELSSRDAAIETLKSKLEKVHRESEKQRAEIQELIKFRNMHEEREREAQDRLRQLMGLMTGAPVATTTTSRRRKSDEYGNDISPKRSKTCYPAPRKPTSEEMVKETPLLPQDDTNYGTAPVLTSTPNYAWERVTEREDLDETEEDALLRGDWSGDETM